MRDKHVPADNFFIISPFPSQTTRGNNVDSWYFYIENKNQHWFDHRCIANVSGKKRGFVMSLTVSSMSLWFLRVSPSLISRLRGFERVARANPAWRPSSSAQGLQVHKVTVQFAVNQPSDSSQHPLPKQLHFSILHNFFPDRWLCGDACSAAYNILAPSWVHPGFTLVSYAHLHYMSILLVSRLKNNSPSAWPTSSREMIFTPVGDETSLQTPTVTGWRTRLQLKLVMPAAVWLEWRDLEMNRNHEKLMSDWRPLAFMPDQILFITMKPISWGFKSGNW